MVKGSCEIIEAGTSPEHYYEFTKLQMFQEMFLFTPKGSVIKLPRKATPIDFAYAVHTKLAIVLLAAQLTEVMPHYKVFLKTAI